MMKYAVVFLVNILYVCVLLYTPSYIEHAENINPDTQSYTNPGLLRTVGYSYILKIDPVSILFMNCALGTWMFFVVFQLIGKRAWILFALGSFTLYVPMLLPDMLFAVIFITSIWQMKRLWLHFLLLGVASLFRPSLAWFFVIEPAVLYFYGYRGRILYLSPVIAFVATVFTPLRNLIIDGQFIHSSVLAYNMNAPEYYGGAESRIGYFYKAFKSNQLGSHFNTIGLMYPEFPWKVTGYFISITNLLIWIRFAWRTATRQVNYGYVIIVAYFVIPTLFAATGGRLRLPIEWILLL